MAARAVLLDDGHDIVGKVRVLAVRQEARSSDEKDRKAAQESHLPHIEKPRSCQF
jgi:hypothetical protein